MKENQLLEELNSKSIIEVINEYKSNAAAMASEIITLRKALRLANEDAEHLRVWAGRCSHAWGCQTNRGLVSECTCGLMDTLRTHTKRIEKQ